MKFVVLLSEVIFLFIDLRNFHPMISFITFFLIGNVIILYDHIIQFTDNGNRIVLNASILKNVS